MAIYKRGKVYWYKFVWNGEAIRQSTKQGNQRVAEQMEAARKTQLAKGEVGIQDRKPVPTLCAFAEGAFLPFVEKEKKGKPRTVRFYQDRIARLRVFPRLWNRRLDTIDTEDIMSYVASRQAAGMEISTINRDLATLRRMFKLAAEWKRVSTVLPKVKLLPGEKRRERVITRDEEANYLTHAATLLADFTILELDCGLRPEEAYRLKWTQVRNGSVEIHTGKTKDARRSIPASPRVMEMFMERRTAVEPSEWIFAAPTKTGHIDTSSLKKQHATALKASQVELFVPYSLRHTCLTRWAESGMDPFTLKRLAGHSDLSTTMRYIHMNDASTRSAMERAWKVESGHKSGHTVELGTKKAPAKRSLNVMSS